MTIEFKQNISEEDFKKATAIHYFGYKWTYITPIIGFLILLTTIGLNISFGFPFEPPHFILITVSLYLMIRPYLYIRNVYKRSMTNKTLHKETCFQITEDDKIIASVDENQSILKLKDLYSYLDKKGLLLLYLSKDQYYIIDKKEIEESTMVAIIEKLEDLNIKKK